MTVFGTLICETVVSETDSGVVISFTDEKKQKEISADTDVVERIKNIVAEHEVIFTYDELECPDRCGDWSVYCGGESNGFQKYFCQNFEVVL